MQRAPWAIVALLVFSVAPRGAEGQGGAAQGRPGEPSTAAVQPTASQFVTEALRGGRAEVAMAQLALEWAGSPEVRELATRLATDRAWLNARIEAIASARDLRLPYQLGAAHRDTLRSLLTLRGAEFDRAWLEATIATHRRDVRLYEAAASGLPDGELSRFAGASLPYLRGHLERAVALQAP